MRGRAAASFLILLTVLLALAVAWVLTRLPSPPDAGQIVDGVYHGPVVTGLPVSLVDAHRQYIWSFSFDTALTAPYFGHGIDVSNYLPGASVLIEKFNQTLIPSHPHSWLLEIFLETGAFGLAALLAALASLPETRVAKLKTKAAKRDFMAFSLLFFGAIPFAGTQSPTPPAPIHSKKTSRASAAPSDNWGRNAF